MVYVQVERRPTKDVKMLEKEKIILPPPPMRET